MEQEQEQKRQKAERKFQRQLAKKAIMAVEEERKSIDCIVMCDAAPCLLCFASRNPPASAEQAQLQPCPIPDEPCANESAEVERPSRLPQKAKGLKEDQVWHSFVVLEGASDRTGMPIYSATKRCNCLTHQKRAQQPQASAQADVQAAVIEPVSEERTEVSLVVQCCSAMISVLIKS